MIYARKGNRISRIEEHQINTLVEQGYDIVDENGAVLQSAVPTDPVLLKKCYVEYKKRIEELEKEVATLRKAVQSQPKKTVTKEKAEKVAEEKVEKVEVIADTEKAPEKPKPKRNTKK